MNSNIVEKFKAEGWKPWSGSKKEGVKYPLSENSFVEVIFKDMSRHRGTVSYFGGWKHEDDTDIIYYREVDIDGRPILATTAEGSSSDWHEWNGAPSTGPTQVSPNAVVEVRLRDGSERTIATAGYAVWEKRNTPFDIVAWRVANQTPDTTWAELQVAAAKPDQIIKKATDTINRPSHYTNGKVECIDAIEAATTGLEGIEAVCTGNAIKYLYRWKLKNGIEDLKKARWYLDRLIAKVEKDA